MERICHICGDFSLAIGHSQILNLDCGALCRCNWSNVTAACLLLETELKGINRLSLAVLVFVFWIGDPSVKCEEIAFALIMVLGPTYII